MKKVILFYPKISDVEILKIVPLSLLSILRYIPNKYDYKIFTEFDEDYINKTLNEIDENTLCVGVSSMTGNQIKGGVELSKLVKKRFPKLPIIWGGWHPSLLPIETLKEPFVDIVVCGRAELTFPELLEALEKRTSLNKVKGIYYKKNSKIFKTEIRLLEKLDNMPPTPYYLLKDIENYIVKEDNQRATNFYTSYGCPYACDFCAIQSIYNRRWNGLNAEKVVDEIENLVKKYKLTKIFTNDDNFYVDEKRVYGILKGLKERKINIKLAATNGKSKTLANYKQETWELMSEYITDILIGAESASQDTLKHIHKECDVEHTFEFAKLCKKYKIQSVYSLMIGFPFIDTEEKQKKEFSEMIKFIKKLMIIDSNSRVMLFNYTPYPANPLFEESKKKGFKEPKKLIDWSNIILNNKTTPWLPDKYALASEMITGYSLPILLNYKNIMNDNERKVKKFSPLLKALFLSAYCITKLRWDFEFFRFPIDYILFKKYMKPKLVNYAKERR